MYASRRIVQMLEYQGEYFVSKAFFSSKNSNSKWMVPEGACPGQGEREFGAVATLNSSVLEHPYPK